MFVAYVILTAMTAASSAAGAWFNFTRHSSAVAAARLVRTPDVLHDVIGTAFMSAAAGLVAGLFVRPIGIAAAAGLVAFFVLALLAHLRVRDLHLGPPLAGLTLSAATLTTTLLAWAPNADLTGASMIAYPDPVWPVVLLALVQLGDGLLCLKPASFIARCFEGVGWPRRLWWMMPPIKFAATLGLLAGIWLPYLGAVTSVCLVAYFVVAIAAHIRARDFGRYLFINATSMFLVCVGVLVYSFLG